MKMIHEITAADYAAYVFDLSVPQMAVGKLGLISDGTNVIELVELIGTTEVRTQLISVPDVYDLAPGQYRIRVYTYSTDFSIYTNVP